MKQIYWYNDFVAIERNGKRHTYAIRQVSSESIRRLWSIRDRCTAQPSNYYHTVYTWRAA